MNGRRLGVAAVLFSTMLIAGSARADEPQCSADVSRGTYLMRAGLLVEARDAMLSAGSECEGARAHAADLAWRIPKVFLHVAGRSLDEVTVLVDGNAIDRADVANAQRLNPGEHVFAARTSDGGERHVAFVLAEGETRSVMIDFEAGRIVPATPPPAKQSESTVSPFVWGGFGVAAVGLAVGAGAAVLSTSKAADVREQCVHALCATSARDDIEAAQRYGTIATVAFVTAAVGAGVGIAVLAFGSKSPAKRETATARVNVGPASVGVAGTF